MKVLCTILSALIALEMSLIAPPAYSAGEAIHNGNGAVINYENGNGALQNGTDQHTVERVREQPQVIRVQASPAVCPTECPAPCPTVAAPCPTVVRPAVVRREHRRNWLLPLLIAGGIIATAIAVPLAVTNGGRGNRNRAIALRNQQLLLLQRPTP